MGQNSFRKISKLPALIGAFRSIYIFCKRDLVAQIEQVNTAVFSVLCRSTTKGSEQSEQPDKGQSAEYQYFSIGCATPEIQLECMHPVGAWHKAALSKLSMMCE